MSLDMSGHVDPTFAATPDGGVTLVTQSPGGYTGSGGVWVPGGETTRELRMVAIQQASMKTAQFLSQVGGVVQPSDLRVLYINDGTMIWPDDDGTFAQILRFSDGQAVRDWRVREADNRPWRNYCKVIAERYRGKR